MAGKRLALIRSMAVVAVVSFLVLLGLTRLFGPESIVREHASEAELVEMCAVGGLLLALLYALARTRIRPPPGPS